MSNGKLNKFFRAALKLPYAPNSQTDPKHELQVKKLLDKFGLKYEYQPNGSQQSPDFLVFYKNKEYNIECKSSKGAFPVYNGGLPKPNNIYIFSSKKYNATTLFQSNDVVSDKMRKCYEALRDELSEVVQKHRKKSDWRNNDRGFDYYLRHMYIQSGGAKYVDYFTHPNREYCERKVLEGRY